MTVVALLTARLLVQIVLRRGAPKISEGVAMLVRATD